MNTVLLDRGEPRDVIATPAGCAAWLRAAGLDIPDGSVTGPACGNLRDLREALRGAIAPLQRGDPVPETVVAAVNRRLEHLRLRFSLEQDRRGPRLAEYRESGGVGPAAIIAEDFARFVCDYEPARLKQCVGPDCTLVFYDTGRNSKRRWCSMRLCGNRDKVARFRARRSQRPG